MTTQQQTDEPIGAVVHRLSEQIPELVRSEIRLAQAELAEKGKHAGLGIGLFSGAGLLVLYGLAGLLTTAVIALDLALPLWLAALIVTVVLFAAAGVAALVGKKQVTQATPAGAREGDRRGQGRRPGREGEPLMSSHKASPAELEADIVQQREQLAATIDELHRAGPGPSQEHREAGRSRGRRVAVLAVVVIVVKRRRS